jgi:hypothetical protein
MWVTFTATPFVEGETNARERLPLAVLGRGMLMLTAARASTTFEEAGRTGATG